MTTEIHSTDRVLTAGTPLERASTAMILLHGRGASAEEILSLKDELTSFGSIAYLAPQATDHTWYPYSFMQPLEANEPHLSSALKVIDSILNDISETGIPLQRTILLGFSQGACLALEFAARNAQRYGAVVGLSGGLIGPDGTPRDYVGSFSGTPVYLGCSDIDAHIPLSRVRETEDIFTRMSAQVTVDIFKNGPHAVFPQEISRVRQLLGRITQSTGRL